MPTPNLEEVITDSVDDQNIPAEPTETTEVEAAPAEEVAQDASATDQDAPETDTGEVASPSAKTAAAPAQTDFEKRFGIPAQSQSGRENRIPHSRVQKIVAKAEKDLTERLTKDHTTALEAEQTKIKEYEDRLTKVAEFENIMVNDRDRFLGMLAQLPAYKDLFGKDGKPVAAAPEPAKPAEDDMPQPDQRLADGTMVYSMDQLKKLMAWQAGSVEKRVTERYAPIEQQWQYQQYVQQLVPQIQAQIADARTWPQFNENEAEITAALEKNQNLSLEGAYRQVVLPKLVTSRDDVRTAVLEEIKKKPVGSTSVSTQASKPRQQAPNGPRNLESVISEAIQPLKG